MNESTTPVSTQQGAAAVPPAPPSDKTKHDHSGRKHLAWNVLTSWLGYFIFVIAGFIMPRMVDHYVGQTTLGIWDFCWSLVNYLALADISIGSSVGRYVAKYRTANDHEALRSAVSTVVAIQGAIALLVLLFTALLVWLLPYWLSDRLDDEIHTIRWVVALLGISAGVQMAADSSRGVITGCHRWDIHNAINSASHLIAVFLMLASLMFGGGLISMASVYLTVVIVAESWRVRSAYRVCPELSVHARSVTWKNTVTMLSYGGKTTIAGMASLLTLQTTSVLVAHALGPAMLAVFARPMALARHVETFINKFSFVLTPTASSLKASGSTDELKTFFIEATRYGFALTMPMLAVLGIFGDVILIVWMGPNYNHGTVVAIIAACYLLPTAQNVSMRIMMGTNSHGRVAIKSLALTALVFAIVTLYINHAGWSLEHAALLAGLPLIVGNGILVPYAACRQLNVAIPEYLRRTIALPLLCNLILVAILLMARFVFPDRLAVAFVAGSAFGLLVLAVLYWFYLLPASIRASIGKKMGRIAGH